MSAVKTVRNSVWFLPSYQLLSIGLSIQCLLVRSLTGSQNFAVTVTILLRLSVICLSLESSHSLKMQTHRYGIKFTFSKQSGDNTTLQCIKRSVPIWTFPVVLRFSPYLPQTEIASSFVCTYLTSASKALRDWASITHFQFFIVSVCV